MRTRNIILAVGAVVVVVAAFIIIATAPKPGSAAPLAVQINQDETLHGENVPGSLYFERGGTLWRWQNGAGKRISSLSAGKSPIIGFTPILTQPAISSDGTRIAYIRRDESYSDLWIANADGSGAHPITANKGQGVVRSPDYVQSSSWAYSPAWSPDGTQIAYLSDAGTDDLALWIIPAGGGRGQRLSSFGQGFGGIQHPRWSSKGTLAVAVLQNGKTQIYTANTRTGTLTELTSSTDGTYDPAWSPDGQRIAYAQRQANGTSDIWIANADGSDPVQISKSVNARMPAWSPDGTRIAFLGLKDKGGFFDIFVADSGKGAGANNQKQVTHDVNLSGTSSLSWSR